MPRNELDLLLPKLEFVRLKAHQVLHEAGETLKSGYFCNAGMFSQQVVMPDGNVLEVAVIGKEGFSAISLVAGLLTAYTRTIVRTEATAFRVEVDTLKRTIQKCPLLERRLQQYAQIVTMQIAQVAACNRFHEMDERLAKWLLMAYDRVGSDTLPLTQEFMADMLGARRSTVTVSAGILQKAGLISYMRGSVKILDQNGWRKRRAIAMDSCGGKSNSGGKSYSRTRPSREKGWLLYCRLGSLHPLQRGLQLTNQGVYTQSPSQ